MMMKRIKYIILLMAIALMPMQSYASEGEEGKEINIPEIVLEHLSDAYEWHIAGDVAIELPIMFLFGWMLAGITTPIVFTSGGKAPRKSSCGPAAATDVAAASASAAITPAPPGPPRPRPQPSSPSRRDPA